jgi:hypothetical protein
MNRSTFSRRQFALAAGTAVAGTIPLRGSAAQSAREVVTRIQTALGGERKADGTDGFKAGDASALVKGAATTAMATLDVLKQAATAGTNLVFTYEPTFFGRLDGQAGIAADDPVYKAKRLFIEENELVVFRLRDHWQGRRENEMSTGLAESMGWSKYRVKSDDALYEIPAATAEDTVALIRKRLSLRGGLRAVGDRKAVVRRILLHPGVMTPAIMWQRYWETDLIVAGEVREWENTHYAADLFTAGEKRGLVTIGRVASEDPGMRACADWMKTVLNDLPVRWIPAGDLYWRAV